MFRDGVVSLAWLTTAIIVLTQHGGNGLGRVRRIAFYISNMAHVCELCSSRGERIQKF